MLVLGHHNASISGGGGGGGGGYKTGRGGRHVKFYRYEIGEEGAEKVLAMLKEGHNKFWGSLYQVA